MSTVRVSLTRTKARHWEVTRNSAPLGHVAELENGGWTAYDLTQVNIGYADSQGGALDLLLEHQGAFRLRHDGGGKFSVFLSDDRGHVGVVIKSTIKGEPGYWARNRAGERIGETHADIPAAVAAIVHALENPPPYTLHVPTHFGAVRKVTLADGTYIGHVDDRNGDSENPRHHYRAWKAGSGSSLDRLVPGTYKSDKAAAEALYKAVTS